MAMCPLCSTRKSKRACPALGRDICPVCCGTKRLSEIACPSDCQYLSASRAHPPAVVQRQQERDLRFLLPRISNLTETQYRLLLLLQATVVGHARLALPPLRDADVAEGAATVAATIETARKGIIYEHQAASLPAQRLAAELGRSIAEITKKAGSGAARIERDAAAALRALESIVRAAETEIPDPANAHGAWLALAARITSGGAAAGFTPESDAASEPSASRIVLP
jgi:hypothetical protein